jgi:hypothetical protein
VQPEMGARRWSPVHGGPARHESPVGDGGTTDNAGAVERAIVCGAARDGWCGMWARRRMGRHELFEHEKTSTRPHISCVFSLS